GVDLDYRASRPLFGEEIRLLEGEHGPLDVELELGEGDWGAYARLEIRFPVSLAQDVQIFSHDRSSPLDQIRKVQEIELGDEDFDREFLLFARDRQRLETYVAPRIRRRLLRLNDYTDEIRLTDRSLFAFVGDGCDRREVAALLKQGIGLARQCVRSARLIGPSSARKRVEDYEAAAFEQGLVGGSVRRVESDGA
ncbi:MAG: hypothetical protein ABEL76_11675, partial [Bradymonadaceae bacterium]